MHIGRNQFLTFARPFALSPSGLPHPPRNSPQEEGVAPSTHFTDDDAKGPQSHMECGWRSRDSVPCPCIPAPGSPHCTCHCPEELCFWGLGEESEEDVARCFCPSPTGWCPPPGQPCLLSPAHRGPELGGRVLPAAVVMPRSRQVYSSPVQNTCCFMVPGVRQGPSRAGNRSSGPRGSRPSVCSGRLQLPALGLCTLGPCLPKPVQATSAWPRCE